jgi:hypothetical protein
MPSGNDVTHAYSRKYVSSSVIDSDPYPGFLKTLKNFTVEKEFDIF